MAFEGREILNSLRDKLRPAGDRRFVLSPFAVDGYVARWSLGRGPVIKAVADRM